MIAHAQRLPVTTYTVADGLLSDRVSKIMEDSRGFFWFCTTGGISRFDGYDFSNFTVADGLRGFHNQLIAPGVDFPAPEAIGAISFKPNLIDWWKKNSFSRRIFEDRFRNEDPGRVIHDPVNQKQIWLLL